MDYPDEAWICFCGRDWLCNREDCVEYKDGECDLTGDPCDAARYVKEGTVNYNVCNSANACGIVAYRCGG